MAKYIDADALMEYLQGIKQQAEADNKTKFDALESTIDVINSTIMMKTDEIMRIVENMPAVDVEPVRHGLWMKEVRRTEWGTEYTNYRCSECNRKLIGYNDPKDAPYCHCGAKMDGGSE